MIYTDAHCHIVAPAQDIAGRIYNSAWPDDWKYAVSVSDADDGVNFATIGIHPWHIARASAEFDSEMRDILSNHPNIMVGEIGLDKFHPDMDRQIEIFTIQLKIAAEFRRPVHLHCVGAWDKILHIFRVHAGAMPPAIVAHGFSGAPDLILQLAEKYNMYFSYSAPNNDNAATRIKQTPKNRILVESDAFDANPEVEILDSTIHAIAGLCGRDPDELSEQINDNFNGVLSYVRPIA